MVDATPSATPMPAQPVATVTSIEALTPLPPPLPHAVAPSVTDPVSNLDFLPVDDAFALEMRSETIEQLVGGDALRRGVSERIEAGRSHTNADLVAGRDRVRVHATLHEHTGHGLAEQGAHLHTTVDGVLDVHAASEDTVLLAGHMSDLWDGGAAIVAAMTDDTAAGGGIRVTAPLDLWVHGLMGVEERIGTCTADAVLMELGATHYEREYGPGVHAAGLAVYTGSLYQSSRSTFRPLMRVSSGVRNLIAAGGGGDGAGAGSARSAPGASPPPVPAQTGAAAKSVTVTLAAGRRTAEVPATALDTADALTDARRAPLEAFVDSVDARVREEMVEAGTVMRAEDLPELTRSADTAEQLGALQETLCIDKTASGSEAAGGFRASEFDGAVSMHPATGAGGPLEIEPHSVVYGENAPIARPHPGVAWGQGPEMKLALLGGADRPPQPAAPESDFHAVYRRLRELRSQYPSRSGTAIAKDIKSAVMSISRRLVRLFKRFGGDLDKLPIRLSESTQADRAYLALQETARQAESAEDLLRAGAIRDALDAIDKHAVEALQALSRKYGIAEAPSTQVARRLLVMDEATVTAAAIPPPTRTPMQFDWGTVFRQLRYLSRASSDTGRDVAGEAFHASAGRISHSVMRRFVKFGGDPKTLPPSTPSTGATKTEQAYRAIEEMSRRAADSGEATQAYELRQALEFINGFTSTEVDKLTARYGALDALPTQDIRAMQRPPPRVGPTTSAALSVTVRPPASVPPTTMPHPRRLDIHFPPHSIARSVSPAFSEPVGGLVHATDISGPPPASGFPGPSLSEAAGAQAGDLGRWWIDPPATVSGTTAAEPAATEAAVTPSLAGTSSFWLQPADPAPPPPPSAAGRTGAGAGASPPAAADPWRIRPQAMSGEPHPVAFDPWSTPPVPSSQVGYTRAIRTPVMSTGAPPRWLGAETPGFARAASGDVELPFWRREEIAIRFGTEDALLDAELTVQLGGADAIGWSATRWRDVLNDLDWINTIVQSDSAAAAAGRDVDWRAIEALIRILDDPPPSP